MIVRSTSGTGNSAAAPRVRHTRQRPCPICGGYAALRVGRGIRCWGFTAGTWSYCSREEFAGGAPYIDTASAYRHRLTGDCRCGQVHGFGAVPPSLHRRSTPATLGSELDPDTLHQVYSAYLDLCRLRDRHRDYFAARGRADLEVALSLGYGSLPLGYTSAREVVSALEGRFGADVVARVPGFYRRAGRIATLTATRDQDDAVIPARDEQGRIVGLVRRTITGPAAKYRTFPGGGADFYTVAGLDWQPGQHRELFLVEGIHKAHVAAELSGTRVMGLPGLTLRQAHLDAIRRLAPDVVIEAFDADKFRTKEVAAARHAAHKKLHELGITVMTAVWEAEDGKGLDDLLATGGHPRLRVVGRRPAVGPRAPVPLPDPAPAPVGMPLAEAQRETHQTIRAFVAHRRQHKGKLLVVKSPPGVGKTRAAGDAIVGQRVAARVVVATHAKAQEFADTYPGAITVVVGRNAENCARFPAVEAARRKGHDVAKVVCETCPVKQRCRTERGMYYAQFRTAGTLVGPVEMLGSGAFLRHGEVVIADDAQLERALIDERAITARDALDLARAVEPGPVRELLTILQRMIDAAGTVTPGQVSPPLIGPPAWDALARAAGGARRLAEVIRTAPPADDLLPHPDSDAARLYLTPEEIEAAPPAVLHVLMRLLHAELRGFAHGRDFNSGLAVYPGTPGKVVLRSLRPSVWDEKQDRPVLQDRAVLILDATPLDALIDVLADEANLTRLPDFAPIVTLPPNAAVTQIADRFGGKATIERTTTATDGAERRPGKEALLASFAAARRDYPGDREAVLCAKGLKADVVARGIPEERVLTFHGSRGMNSVEDADVLHVLGRPQAPDHQALALAHVLYKHQAPVSPHLTLKFEPYAGYRAPDGGGRAIEVLDFADSRVSAIFRQSREAELWQGVHRARLFRVGDAQGGIFDPQDAAIAREAEARRWVRVVIHSAHPIPGLRVDELVYAPPAQDANAARAAESDTRIATAIRQLGQEGAAITVAAVVRRAGASRRAVGRMLPAPRSRNLGAGVPTFSNDLSPKGRNTPYQIASPPELSAGADAAPAAMPCSGGCGRARKGPAPYTCWMCAGDWSEPEAARGAG